MSYLTPEQARAEQLREGQRMARCDDDSTASSRPRLTARPGYEGRAGTRAQRPAKPKAAPTGHEAFLKALHESGARIRVYLLDQDEPLVGKIRAHDKYTVSIDEEMMVALANSNAPVPTEPSVIFKHAIQRINPLRREQSRPAPVAAAAERAEEGHYQ